MSAESQSEPTIIKLLEETAQSSRFRREIVKKLEIHLGERVVYYFTSFRWPVAIDNADAVILEGLLQKLDLNSGLVLMINSPGGDGLAAERIINVCRSYSGGKFRTIVPKMAKSAATIVCLGSNEILMSDTSELGPIDPQIVEMDDKGRDMRLSLWSILSMYKGLMKDAIKTKGNLEPYLIQLDKYHPSQMKQWQLESGFAADVAVQCLQKGMLASEGLSDDKVRNKIAKLLNPEKTKSHARPVYSDAAREMGLKVCHLNTGDPVWGMVWELYIRADHYVTTKAGKIIGCSEWEFEVPITVSERTET